MCYSLFIPSCSRKKKATIHKSRVSRIVTLAKKKKNIRRMLAIAININVNFDALVKSPIGRHTDESRYQ